MRKIFKVGGALGLRFERNNIDLKMFKEMPLGITLPDSRRAELQVIEIIFQKPDFSDIADTSAHRASTVNITFVDEYREEVTFEVSGAYFWRFLESVPEQFRVLSENNTKESYINESLEAVMQVARHVYHMCFIDTTMENACPPPESCRLELKTGNINVVRPLVLPEAERVGINKIVDKEIGRIDLTVFSSDFVDDMLKSGYLTREFKSEGEYIVPTFEPTPWDKDKHKVINDYLSELSDRSNDDCPAYLQWSELFNVKLKAVVRLSFDAIFNKSELNNLMEFPTAQRILQCDGDLFEVQGANEAVDQIYSRAISSASQYLLTASSKH
jgi:hypothetical protein